MKGDPILQAEFVEVEAEASVKHELAITLHNDGAIDINEKDVKLDIERFCSIYDKPQITDKKSYQQAKKDRSALNAEAKKYNDRRLEVARSLKSVLDTLKTRVDDLIDPITALSKEYKAAIDEWEDQQKQKRAKELREHYAGFAGFLVDRLPYERIHDDSWLNQSMNLQEAFEAIEVKCEGIAKDDAAIDEMLKDLDLEKHINDVKRHYFETLDFGAAIQRARKIKRDEERNAEFERQKAELEAQRQAQRAAQEAVECRGEPMKHLQEPEEEAVDAPETHQPSQAEINRQKHEEALARAHAAKEAQPQAPREWHWQLDFIASDALAVRAGEALRPLHLKRYDDKGIVKLEEVGGQ